MSFIVQDDDMCGYDVNAFYKINAVSHRMLVSSEIIIGTRKLSPERSRVIP